MRLLPFPPFKDPVTEKGEKPHKLFKKWLDLVQLSQFRGVNFRLITASETYAPNLKKVRAIAFLAIGGGASGGGVDGQGAGTSAVSTPGSGGGWCFKLITAPEKSYTVTIGAGGAAPSAGANNGNDGGATTISSAGGLNVNAGGGLAGSGFTGTSGGGGASGANGGGASGGDLNVTGGPSGFSRIVGGVQAQIPAPGSSVLGGALATVTNDANGTDATQYGCGGGAARTGGTTSNFAGGAGFQGCVLLLEIF